MLERAAQSESKSLEKYLESWEKVKSHVGLIACSNQQNYWLPLLSQV